MSDTVIIEIPIEDLRDSPTNPRTTYVDSDTQELADNIRSTGRVLQPLQVRPRTTALFGNMPDSHVGYEIVFGHRRRRAAELAGFTTVPCMVRAMTDIEVKIAQVSENLQRKDVHPFEEAQGFQALLDEGHLTAKDLMAQFGKTHTYVYGRLALLQAIPEVRKACIAGEIGAEAALLIARLRAPKLQQKALGYIDGKYLKLNDGGKKTHKAIRDLLNERFSLELKDTIFPPNDATLVSAAGGCDVCPKRSGNAPEFADIVEGNPKGRNGYYEGYLKRSGADVCTDPDCFAAKKTAHLQREAMAMERQGQQVIGGNRARALIDAYGNVKGGYIPLKVVPAELKSMAASTLMGRPLARVTIQDPRTGKTVEVVKETDAKEFADRLCIDAPKAPEPRSSGYQRTPEQIARDERDRKRAEEKLAAENARRRALLDQVRATARARPRSEFDLRLIVRVMLRAMPDRDEQRTLVELHGASDWADLVQRTATMSADGLGLLMLDLVLVEHVYTPNSLWLDRKPEQLLAAAEHYGVAASTPSTAARARKGATAAAGVKKSRSLRGAGRVAQAVVAGDQEKNDEAGCAGDHDGQAQLELDTEAGQEVDQTVDAGCAGVHVDQAGAPAEALA